MAATVADEVVTAAEAAIAATRDDGTPIDFRVRAHARVPRRVHHRAPHAPTLAATHLSRGPGLSVDWQPSGAQLVCHIRQAMA